MSTALLDDVAAANRPRQFGLLEKTVDVLSHSRAVRAIYVRGSLAVGTADRLSDLDFIVAVDDADFTSFVWVADALMAAELGAILPGWRDTIVARMGGLGYVYLVAHDDKLYQTDLYLVPASRLGSVLQRTTAMPVYLAKANTVATRNHLDWFLTSTLERAHTPAELLTEILVLAQMVAKRITRGQRFIAYAEMFALHTAAKNLIKTVLAPSSRFYGWYQLTEEIGATPIGRACLADLDALICGPALPTRADLTTAINLSLQLAHRAIPEVMTTFGPAIDAYRHYLDLP